MINKYGWVNYPTALHHSIYTDEIMLSFATHSAYLGPFDKKIPILITYTNFRSAGATPLSVQH